MRGRKQRADDAGRGRTWRAEPLGDGAVLLRYMGRARPGDMADAAAWLQADGAPGLAEAVPAYDTIALHLDPAADATTDEMAAWAIRRLRDWRPARRRPARTVRIPVVYGGEEGPDLEEAAARCGLTAAEFAARHAAAVYEVAAIGFAPGFPYLAGLPEELAQPRRAAPRARVPAGSVGIAGRQTGIYPVDSPGGWTLIGRTPLPLFRPHADDPFLLRPGDRVVFVPVDRTAAAEGIDAGRTVEGTDAGRTAEGRSGGPEPALAPSPEREPARAAAFAVLDPGLHTTVQDGGRPGWQAFGVPVGGAMDREAMRIANRLVGNAADAAVLELTLRGGAYRTERDVLIAVYGADLDARADGRPLPTGCPVRLDAGTVLSFGRPRRGCRAYLAIAGGFDVQPVLGSRSTDVRAGIGGVDGRPLREGDVLFAGSPSMDAVALMQRLAAVSAGREASAAGAAGRAARSFVPHPCARWNGGPVELRVLPGRSWEAFAERSRRTLTEAVYTVSASADRMGLRLEGPALERTDTAEIVSHGVVPGTIQVPGDGRPIVLGRSCQPTGGYPVIAHVIRADLWKLAQLRPGDRVRFRPVSDAEARRLFRLLERELRRTEAGIRLQWFEGRRPGTEGGR